MKIGFVNNLKVKVFSLFLTGYYKRGFLFLVVSLSLISGRIVAQAPSDGLVLWLKADKGIITDTKGLDSLWQDQSGNKTDAFQTTNTLRPSIVKNDINGRSALRFGNGTFLNAPSRFPVNSSYTVIVVMCPQNLNVYGHILSGTSTRYLWLGGTAYPEFGQNYQSLGVSNYAVPSAFCTIAAVANDSSKLANIYVNGKNGDTATYRVTNSDSGISIGALWGENTFEGDIAEILVYNRALNNSELNAADAYLNGKYGINLPANTNISLNHFPAHLQFFQRDGYDSALVKIDGAAVKQGYDSVSLEVYKNTARVGYFSHPLSYAANKASFSFLPKIHAELAEYSFVLHLKKGSADTIVAKESDIVCGDSYIICGQSNAVAIAYGSNYISEYARSFGSLTGYNTDTPDDTAWGYANGSYYTTKGISFIGGVGIQIAQNLLEKYKIPVCIINGAVTGGPIEINLRNNANPTDLTTIYGRMLYRMIKSGMDTCAKAIIWYHGAANTILNYYPNFTSLYNSWKSDYKNLKKFYVMQIRPSICGAGTSLALRELQRTLSDSLPDITILSVNNAPDHNGCHFDNIGYDTIGNWATYLIEKDFYQSTDTLNINPLNIEKAFYTDTSRTVLKITFTEKNAGVSWSNDVNVSGTNYNIKDAFYLNDTNGLIKSVSVSGDTLSLNLYKPEIFSKVTYIPDHYYEGTLNCYEGPWLINKRGIGAFAFYEFPVVVIPEVKVGFHSGSACIGQPYNFQDSSFLNTGTITKWKWDFGDGDSSNMSNISHVYIKPGNYQVKLTVQSSTGFTDSITKTIQVFDVPNAGFTYKLLSGRIVRFSATDSLESGYVWVLGDGGTAGTPEYTHPYTADGKYIVKLTVTNTNGCQSSATNTIDIQPTIKASFSFYYTCLGTPTVFQDYSTISSGNIVTRQWDFGDSSIPQLQDSAIYPFPKTSHTYTKAGSYLVKLIVTDAFGTKDSVTRVVTINGVPDANFTWTVLSGRTVQFIPDDSAAGTIYYWGFGDGNTSAASSPVHTYVNDDNYDVSLKVENSSCFQVHSAVFKLITPIPKASFNFIGTCFGTSTTLTGLSSIDIDSIVSWQWDFGDSTVSSDRNPQHVFRHPGTYHVQLKILSLDGTTDSITRLVIINPLPDARFNIKTVLRTLYFSSEDTTRAYYYWTFGDGFGSFYPWGFHTYEADGKYNLNLYIRDLNGCGNQKSDSITISGSVSGIEDISLTNPSVKIFPNPFSTHTQIALETDTPSNVVISVYDVAGHLISVIANCNQPTGTGNYIWDAENGNLPSGLYIVKILVGGSVINRQLIKLQ